jgi:hypothetical protein
MVLCDHAQVADGKLFIAGGGWNMTGTPTPPSAIAVLLQIPWGEANRPVRFHLRLITADGQPVAQPGPAGQPIPVEIAGELEVGRPPGVPEGTMLNAPVAVNIQTLLLDSGQRYVWELQINGERDPNWQLPFTIRKR